MSTVPLDKVKAHLNMGTSTNDGELQAMVDASEMILANHVGPLAATTKTDRIWGGVREIVLKTAPVISLTSVTPSDGAAALTLTDLHLETTTGIVTYNTNRAFVYRYYDIVYSAGRSSLPDDLELAVKELTRALWKDSQTSTVKRGSPVPGGPDPVLPLAGRELPFVVQKLIAPHRKTVVAG